jgi:riboflavin-specific deaminase-like protein
VRQLLPVPTDPADPVALTASDERPAPSDRPWVIVNMIASIDGATAVEDRSGGLGGPPDRSMFRALRELPDAILVGASTVRTEGYGPVRLDDAAIRRRRARGQTDTPRLVIVSGSLRFDTTSALFHEAEPPMVITHAKADERRRAELAELTEVVVAGTTKVEMREMLEKLRAMDMRTLLCEGGPILNAQLIAEDLVDEWCQTFSPLLVGGDSSRAATGDASPGRTPPRFRLRRLLEADDMLLANYVRGQ